MEQTINCEKIIIAREFNKLTQKQLIEELEKIDKKITQGELSKIEQGLRKDVSDDLLNAISKILDFPKDFFLTPWERQNIKGGLYRKRQSLKKKDEGFVDSSVNLFIQTFNDLSKNFEINTINIPHFSVYENNSPAHIAKKTREFWNVPQGPIEDLTTLLEDNGIVINYINVSEQEFDGYSCMLDNFYFIFINPDMPADRLRFTIAHELGHLIMKNEDTPYPQCDDEANKFASAFLMPEDDIKFELMNLNCEKAYYLKPKWKVSMAALIRRARDLDAITQSRYTSLNVQMSKLGYRKNEPIVFEKERPSLFEEIINLYIENKKETLDDIAQRTNISKNVLIKLYKPHRNNIRAIN